MQKTRANPAPESPRKAPKNILLEETRFLYTCLPVGTDFSLQPTSFHFCNCVRALAALIGLNDPDKLIMKVIVSLGKPCYLEAAMGLDKDLKGRGEKGRWRAHEHHETSSVPWPELHLEQLAHSRFLAQK